MDEASLEEIRKRAKLDPMDDDIENEMAVEAAQAFYFQDVPDLITALEESRRENERLREACLLANEAFGALCLHPTNEVPEDFFAAWSRATDGEGIGYRAHSAVHWAAIHPAP